MARRAVLFHRRFPEARISPFQLRQFYRQNHITRKKLRFVKLPPRQQEERIKEEKAVAARRLEYLESRGFEIIYLDEICTTTKTLPTTAWSLPHRPLHLDFKSISHPVVATIAAVSAADGVVLIQNFPKSIDRSKFASYLRDLREVKVGRKIALFMDNLSVHKSAKTLALMRELDLEAVFNAAYSPDLNPIERVFAQVKKRIKELKLQALVDEKPLEIDQIIHKAFNEVQMSQVKVQVERSRRLLDS